MISRYSLTGRAITWLQFPLALMVLTMHTTYNTQAEYPLLGLLTFIAWAIPVMAVPGFFFIAGYLFFAGRETYGVDDYIQAMRRRSRTLLLPYVLWMLIAYIFNSIDSGTLIRFTDLQDFIKNCWGGSLVLYRTSLFGTETITMSMPGMLCPLWFLRDLMCISLLTPLIWIAGKHLRLWALVPVVLVYFAGIGTNLPCLQPKTLFYFPVGAILAINGLNIAHMARRALPFTLAAWLVLCLVYSCMALTFDTNHLQHGIKTVLLYQCLKITGVAAMTGIAVWAVSTERQTRLLGTINSLFTSLAPSTIFIYLIQGLRPVERLNTLCHDIFEGSGVETDIFHIPGMLSLGMPEQLAQAMTYVSAWLVRLAVILAIYALMRRYAPRMLSVLTGGRSDRPASANDMTGNKVEKIYIETTD